MCDLPCAKMDYFYVRKGLTDIGLINAENMEYSALNTTKDEFNSKWYDYTIDVITASH